MSLTLKVLSVKKLVALFAWLLATVPVLAANPHVVFKTSLGEIELELAQDAAPITVANFLAYVNSGQYNGEIFHRVIPGFVAQGGGLLPNLTERATLPPIKNEAANGLANLRGTIAMARTNVVDSATAQFFINLVDNNFLNHVNNTASGYGYAVFGKVVRGMDVVDRMATVPTVTIGPYADVPATPIVINQAVGVMAASVAASGVLKQQTLKLDFSPASRDVGKSGHVFVAAALPNGALYTLGANGWTNFDAANPSAYAAGPLQGANFNLVSGVDLSGLMGTAIYVGYGVGETPAASLADLLSRQNLQMSYTIK